MTAPREAILEKVREWVCLADDDLRLAEHAKSMSRPPYPLLGYHAQQCAEKYLKAYLVQKGVDFPYTHSISALLELCGRSALWAASLADAEDLTRFSTTARYPGIGKAVSKQEAVVALETAKRVRSAVRLALEEAGVDLVSRGK